MNKLIEGLGAIALAAMAAVAAYFSNTTTPASDPINQATGNPPGKQCTVSPGSVYDGDTARFLCNGEEIKVRFCGIDAPEAKQPGGIEARDYLRSLLPDNAPVTIVPVERDRYGRLVAEVWRDDIEGEQNLNANMVLARHAWHYEQYSGNCPNRGAIVTAAELAGPMEGMAPWEWRRQN